MKQTYRNKKSHLKWLFKQLSQMTLKRIRSEIEDIKDKEDREVMEQLWEELL